jgi:tetratricopeptide (TPR) repeat protein
MSVELNSDLTNELGDDVQSLQARAIGYARRGDFGPDALTINQRLALLAPQNAGAWTRLGRCHLEAKNFPAAAEALQHALALDPQSVVARNLLVEVRRARQFVATDDKARNESGFDVGFFDLLGQTTAQSIPRSILSRVETLVENLNNLDVSEKIVAARLAAGRTGSRLYRRNSVHGENGHVYIFHYGGRWEPQFNLGFFSAHTCPANCVRAGVGFNLTRQGMDPNPDAGQARVRAYLASFQRAVSARWQRYLSDWMRNQDGQLQFTGESVPPDAAADRQLDRLVRLNPAAEDWVFLGRWWNAALDRDRGVLSDMRQITQAVAATFRDLLPVWKDTWINADISR